jgi:carbonic anhydrase/acetyltransferase-like protein (isoleucine patch superfamily)
LHVTVLYHSCSDVSTFSATRSARGAVPEERPLSEGLVHRPHRLGDRQGENRHELVCMVRRSRQRCILLDINLIVPEYLCAKTGDGAAVTIGESTTIGDNVMIHCDGPPKESPVTIGSRVTVGPNATIHGATIEDEVVIGGRSTILDFAVIRRHGALAPGSLLSSGKEIKTGELWAGVPAKFVRHLSPAEIEHIPVIASEGVEYASLHSKDVAKTHVELLEERDEYYQEVGREAYYYKQRLSPEVCLLL